jgi:hypothetical protein
MKNMEENIDINLKFYQKYYIWYLFEIRKNKKLLWSLYIFSK